MRTAGRFSNASDGDKCADDCARAHEHTGSHPDVDQHAETYSHSDECGYCHTGADANSEAVGNGYTHPDGPTGASEHSHADSDSSQYEVTGGYGHTDSYKYTVTNTSRHECANSHINTRDIGDSVAHVESHSSK